MCINQKKRQKHNDIFIDHHAHPRKDHQYAKRFINEESDGILQEPQQFT